MVQVATQVRNLKAGDRFRSADGSTGWDALEDAWSKPASDVVSVKVQHYPDGGIGEREWDDASRELTVERMT